MLVIDKDNPPIGEDEVRACFFAREDIRNLPPPEQDALWERHKASIRSLWSLLHGVTAAESVDEVGLLLATESPSVS